MAESAWWAEGEYARLMAERRPITEWDEKAREEERARQELNSRIKRRLPKVV